MIKNYFKIAFRNLTKEKTFTAINIIGLSLAFGASILLFLTANFHLTFDDFQEHRDEIFKVYLKVNRPDKTEYGSAAASPMQPALLGDYPDEITAATRVVDGGVVIRKGEKNFDIGINFVDQSYFELFTTETLDGNTGKAFTAKNSIVLRKQDAIKIFGNTSVQGEQVEVKIGSEYQSYIVSAVIDNFPKNSTMENESLINFEEHPSYNEGKDNWNWRSHDLYVKLLHPDQWTSFEKRLKSYTKKYFKSSIEQGIASGFIKDERGEVISTRLLPLKKEHFDLRVGKHSIEQKYPYFLLGIGILILLIASINFINLSIVRSFTRAKEVGMRKALGAFRSQIIGQFWGEAILICLIAIMLGLTFSYTLIPQFNAIINGELEFSMILHPKFILIIGLCFILVTALAGGYPAMLVSAFNTVEVLKGKVRTNMTSGKLRNGLLVLQFAISVLLLACTFVVSDQIQFMRNMPLGYDQKQVISVPIPNGADGYKYVDAMRKNLSNLPNIVNVTGADINLGTGKDNNGYQSKYGFDYKGKEVITNGLSIDFDYVETLGLELVAGRSFDRKYSTDSTLACIINETMAKQLGGNSIVGSEININKGMKVIGVVKDFHFESLKNKIEPQTMFLNLDFGLNYAFIKVKNNNLPSTMKQIEDTHKSLYPNSTFLGSFLDENLDNQYKNEARIAKIFIVSAGLAILLSCFGLFAIALMVIRQRTKEVGVRKVLGADVLSIVSLLSKDFIVLIMVAIAFSIPIAYYVMNLWLEEFPFRVDIKWWLLALSATISIVIGMVTVLIHAVKAASTNPVNSLKSE